MFSYINGEIESKHDRYIVSDISGIGYKIYTTLSTLSKVEVGTKTKLLTHVNVREDAFDIYGFIDHEELSMFEHLISVSGIGAKVAINILSSISAEKLAFGIISADVNMLCQAQGVGKKTAQRIILELKDKIESVKKSLDDENDISVSGDNSYEEVLNALIVLGFSLKDAKAILVSSYDKGISVEENIKKALKNSM